ncbi:MAG: hypothetical protein KDD51_06870 [Bdellovibrionales bacterium]|nr:hypothetical protein [Bdellovibrionales bacterium]
MRAFTEPLQLEESAVADTDRRVLVYYPDADGEPVAILHVIDRNDLFSKVTDKRFSLVLKNSTLMERLLFLHNRLRRRNQHVKVSFNAFETDITYLDQVRAGSGQRPTDIFLHFEGDRFAAEPNLLLASVIHQMMMDELRKLFPGTIEALIEETYRTRVSAEGSVPVERIYELLRLRSAWYLTTEFYTHCVPPSPQAYTSEFFRREFGEGVLASSFEFFEQTRLHSYHGRWSQLDNELKAAFERFYDVEASLVEALWSMPLPGRWEFSLAAPPTGARP